MYNSPLSWSMKSNMAKRVSSLASTIQASTGADRGSQGRREVRWSWGKDGRTTRWPKNLAFGAILCATRRGVRKLPGVVLRRFWAKEGGPRAELP